MAHNAWTTIRTGKRARVDSRRIPRVASKILPVLEAYSEPGIQA